MNLQLIQTEDMIVELKRRYPMLIIVGSADISQDYTCELMMYHGPVLGLIGATMIAQDDLKAQYRDGMEPASDTP